MFNVSAEHTYVGFESLLDDLTDTLWNFYSDQPGVSILGYKHACDYF
jgi:hypothetical protein